jgi:hypothetical protein
MPVQRPHDARVEVVDDAVAHVLRTKTPAERILMMGEAWRSAMAWLVGVIGTMHPDWDRGRIMSEVLRRLGHGPG